MATADADLETLEQEREFLLRSLADLDAEHEAGDIEDDDYQSLTDDYTARAAAVLRAIEAVKPAGKRGGGSRSNGTSATRRPPSGPSRRPPAPSSVGVGENEADDEADGEGGTGRAGGTGRSRRSGDTGRSRRSGDTGRTGDEDQAERRALGDSPVRGGSQERAGSHGQAGNHVRAGSEGRVGGSDLLAAALQSRRRWRTAAVVVAVVGFGAVAAWAVARSSGTRLAGQTATGNSQITGSTVAGGIDPRLTQAATDVNNGQVTDALKLYDAVLADDPSQPVALADGGWLEAQAGLSANRSDLVDTGLAKIAKAEQVDPSYADPHFFRGFLLLRAKNDAPDAVTEFRTYLGSVDPTAPQVARVQGLLQEAIKASGPNVPPGPNAPTTTTPSTGSATTARP